MRKLIFCLLFPSLLTNLSYAQRNCGLVEHFQNISAQDPSVLQRRDAIEQFTRNFISSGGASSSRSVITIPVVVHVVYTNAAQNLSDAQILSQIDRLNQDFRKLNPDWINTPSVFQSAIADCGIQFALAKRDPSGNATNGIIRKPTTRISFGLTDDVKFTSLGGDDAWPRASYLNIWVCNLGGQYLGYADYPGGQASTDGVVIQFDVFGSTGILNSLYDKGRTATHEIGHWLNLIHTWGDDSGGCTGSDNVDDTPNQGGASWACPVFPQISCNNGPNGDMFMNYMDYAYDVCMYMFTNGQNTRMQAMFAVGGPRTSLLSSLGCQVPASSCGIPIGCSVSNITLSSANISWNPIIGTTLYDLQYKPNSSSVWTTISTSSNAISLTGLIQTTTYEYRVRSNCGYGSSAYYSPPSFTTLSANPCNTPTGLSANGVNQTAATIAWVPVTGVNGYNLQLKASTSGNWMTLPVANPPITFSGLTSGTNYIYQVQALCSGGGSYYSPTSTFTTLTSSSSCTAPVGLVTVNLTQISTTLSWSSVSGAVGYNIQYKPSSAPTWSTISSNSSTINLSGLTAGTTYNYQVQTVCSSGNSSYSSLSSFTTLAAIQLCDAPTGLSANGVSQTSATANWSAASGATGYNIQYKPSSSGTWTILTSSLPSTNLTGLTPETSYDYAVRTLCSSGSSNYSSISTFTTQPNTSAPTCADNFEPNNTLTAAMDIPVNSDFTSLINSNSDIDYYNINNVSSAQKYIRISLTNLPADYDVKLLKANGSVVASAQHSGIVNEVIKYTKAVAGIYYVQVYSRNHVYNASSCYTLNASVSTTALLREASDPEDETQQESETVFNLYPNPSTGIVNLDMIFAEPSDYVEVSVHDLLGNRIRVKSYSQVEGSLTSRLDLNDLPDGVYSVLINTPSSNETRKLILAR